MPTYTIHDLIRVPSFNATHGGSDIDGPFDNISITTAQNWIANSGDTMIIDGISYSITNVWALSVAVAFPTAPTQTWTERFGFEVLNGSTGQTEWFYGIGDSRTLTEDISTISLNGFAYSGGSSGLEFLSKNNFVCFSAETRIATADGSILARCIAVGDQIRTLDNGLQTVRWVGRKTIPAIGIGAPVVFETGAIGNSRPLKVSQQHRMLVSDGMIELLFGEAEMLVAAKHLVNGQNIRIVEGGFVDYVHFLFDKHEIVFAEGAASESFHPNETGMATLDQKTREEIYLLFPELEEGQSMQVPLARGCLKGWEAQLSMC